MNDPLTDARVLTSSHVWRATPWDYSSLRSVRLRPDGSGELLYGYGQTIYALIQCRWELPTPGVLRLTYLESPPRQRFKGFTPGDGNSVKELEYTLSSGEFTGVESIVGFPFHFRYKLELSRPPWPDGLQLPYEVPTAFYGHPQQPEKTESG
jgi:hypothetical protein